MRRPLLFAAALGTSVATPPAHSLWSLAFSDEFEGATLDASKWSVSCAIEKTGPGSWNYSANVRFQGGRLQLYGEKSAGQGTGVSGKLTGAKARPRCRPRCFPARQPGSPENRKAGKPG